MRKTTAYARKVRNSTGMYKAHAYNGLAFASVIQRSRPYTDEAIPYLSLEASDDMANRALGLIKGAFDAIQRSKSPASETRDFDLLAHALGLVYLRAIDIAGERYSDNPMLEIWNEANEAMKRLRTRHQRFAKWELDKMAVIEVSAAIELYETILKASSPAQMEEATVRRMEILAMQREMQC